ncbi:uncharacterized protein LOC141809830 [Halichoeres trimaculatus]|uniref:uncharacterized protein LOC141809830 n=1 Tax=Halichoeres trimaculatus TaxID=147232 RepID=UPI003D9EF50A
MEQPLLFTLLLFSLPVTESMRKDESCLSQPKRVIQKKSGQSVVLQCTKSSHCLTQDPQFEWFCFRENSHLRLNLHSNPQKYSLEGASLRIESLHGNDSGIYHCAATSLPGRASGNQLVGLGTTLVVTEKANVMVRDILLWSSFVLLAIYSLALVTLIIKKHGCSMSVCRKMPKTLQSNSTKKRQFRDVLQEIHSRNSQQREKQAAESVDYNNSTDDIYQNV